MRLLLDEHYSPTIAEELRKRRHDVVAAAALPELRQRHDADVLEWASGRRRALVTENVRDYLPLHQDYLFRGKIHWGIVFTDGRRFQRSRAGIGRLVKALDVLLKQAVNEEALRADLRWL